MPLLRIAKTFSYPLLHDTFTFICKSAIEKSQYLYWNSLYYPR